MDNQLPARKIIRLPEYDYSSVGTYFITICTKDRRCILRHRVGTRIARPQDERTVINQLKGYTTKKIGHPIWQHRFYDHIIRGKHDFEKLSLYIDDNPGKWLEDELYSAR